METPIIQTEATTPEVHQLTKVTPLSKYFALAVMIVLPFIGGVVGYALAPETVVEVERVVSSNGEQPANPAPGTAMTPSEMRTYPQDARYTTDGVKVYLNDDLTPIDDVDKVEQYVIEGADPTSFEPAIVKLFPISQGNTYQKWISRDKNSVYYQYKKIEGADPATFVIAEEIPITLDADDVFLFFEKIPNADPKTYKVVFNLGTDGPRRHVFGQDATHCFLDRDLMECSDMPTSFAEAVKVE